MQAAVAVDQIDQPVDVSGAKWEIEGGTIDKDGLFTAGSGEGTFKISATVGSITAQATLEISEGALPPPPPPPPATGPKRFHGSVSLNPSRVGRDASQIAAEIVAHLEGLVGSELKVTLEIEAFFPEGAPENVVRTVTENSNTLKFTSHGFEDD